MQTSVLYTSVPSGHHQVPSLRIMASGKCNAVLILGRQRFQCTCPTGIFTISSESNRNVKCASCDHLLQEHDDVEQPPPEEISATKHSEVISNPVTCPREDTVSAFADLIASQPVVHVRGTPASGKTTLAHLLCRYLEAKGWNVFTLWQWGNHIETFHEQDPWLAFTLKLQRHYPQHRDADIHASKSVLLIDEAQGSYSDDMFWNQIIKGLQDGRVLSQIHICLFCSYGSPSTAVEPQLYTPARFHPRQRITITPQPKSESPQIGLFFTEVEFDDAVSRTLEHQYIDQVAIDQGARSYLFSLTNGHPGAVYALLSYVHHFYRSDVKHGKVHTIKTQDIVISLKDEDKLWGFLNGHAVARGYPKGNLLTQDAAKVLTTILEQGSIPWDDSPGMDTCFTQGWIHKTTHPTDPLEREVVVLPSRLHEKYVEHHLGNNHTPLPASFGTPLELCGKVLAHFSAKSLRQSSQGKTMSSAASYRPVEAQYQDEFYKAFKMVARRGVTMSSEWSRTKDGRVDFWIPDRKWAIELLRGHNKIDEHILRFRNGGSYHDWIRDGMIRQWIVINCATTPPTEDHPERNLIHAIFEDEFRVLKVFDNQRQLIQCSSLVN